MMHGPDRRVELLGGLDRTIKCVKINRSACALNLQNLHVSITSGEPRTMLIEVEVMYIIRLVTIWRGIIDN